MQHKFMYIYCVLALVLTSLAVPAFAVTQGRFEVSFPTSVHAGPITGRLIIIVTKKDQPDPRVQALFGAVSPPLFGKRVNELQPGENVVFNNNTPGYPVHSLKELPVGNYYVEAILNVYTRVHRADGHTVWVHFDWAGEQPTIAPGNLHSVVKQVHIDPAAGFDIHLSLNHVITKADFKSKRMQRLLGPGHSTKWLKVIKFKSPLLTKFWGHPMYVGATVLLPAGYAQHPNVHYPVIYNQGHFDQSIPWGFNPNPPRNKAAAKAAMGNEGTGYEFYKAWTSSKFPRFILVTFQEPCPYFDDGYDVNSANCGPYGDVVMKEIIPYLESHFRMIDKPYARILEGGSTGGWESLALQVLHPGFFGGAWVFDPDPIDFRSFQLTNLYKDKNAFYKALSNPWYKYSKHYDRTSRGLPLATIRQQSAYEAALGGPHCLSGHQLCGWWAIFDPVGPKGYPEPMWNMHTGKINHKVVDYARDHGYDLSYYIQTHWSTIGPQLVGKLHFFVGDMDNYYLNLSVYRLQDFLEKTKHPYYNGSFTFGRPMKGHGWHPMSWARLLRDMAEYVRTNAPASANTASWNY